MALEDGLDGAEIDGIAAAQLQLQGAVFLADPHHLVDGQRCGWHVGLAVLGDYLEVQRTAVGMGPGDPFKVVAPFFERSQFDNTQLFAAGIEHLHFDAGS